MASVTPSSGPGGMLGWPPVEAGDWMRDDPTGQCQIKDEYKCRVTVLFACYMLRVTELRVLAANTSLEYSDAN